jgi:hypothetical protein
VELISKMSAKIVYLILFGVVVDSLQSAAENVTIEKILDLTVFGQCNIYYKMFRPDQETVDLTERAILAQQQLRKNYALTCIYNATSIDPMVSPSVSLYESCVLTVIVGIVPYDSDRLGDFMLRNNYTFSSTPFSTYILIPGPFQAKWIAKFPRRHAVMLPVRIFYLLLPTFREDDSGFYTSPYIFVCAHCEESSWKKEMRASSDLASISSLNFSSFWSRNDVQIVNEDFLVTHDVTDCERGPWERIFRTQRSVCSSFFSFMVVISRSVHPNFTVSARDSHGPFENRCFGFLQSGYFTNPSFSDASSSWFQVVNTGGLSFCDCKPKSRKELLRAWATPFERKVWLGLTVTYLLLGFTVGTKLHVSKRYSKKSRVQDFAVGFMAVAGLYLRQEGVNVGCRNLLLLTSLCIGVILSLYENIVTSEIVVPPPTLEHNLTSLVMDVRSKVIYVADNTATNQRLKELELEARKWNIKYSKDQFQSTDDWYRISMAPPLENGTSLSYFGFYSAVESDSWLRKVKLLNNKCHCYIVKHEFRQKESYITFKIFLMHRFVFMSNILRQSGIISYFTEEYRTYEHKIRLTNVRRQLEKGRYHSEFFVRERTGMDLIKLRNLVLLFVMFGGMGLFAVNIFILEKSDWLALCVYCKGLVSKYLRAV